MKLKLNIVNPTGSNIYRNKIGCDGATPSGSNIFVCDIFYKHINPSGCENDLKEAVK